MVSRAIRALRERVSRLERELESRAKVWIEGKSLYVEMPPRALWVSEGYPIVVSWRERESMAYRSRAPIDQVWKRKTEEWVQEQKSDADKEFREVLDKKEAKK